MLFRSANNTYVPLLGTNSDTESQMYNLRTSAYIRVPFNLTGAASVSSMKLKMKYDDGFAAFINGQPAAADRAPTSLNFNSIATNFHDDAAALIFSDFDITLPNNLTDGENILAIQGLNWTTDSSDFVMLPELEVTTAILAPNNIGFHTTSTPNAVNTTSVEGFVDDTKFSTNRGFFTLPINVAITTTTADAQMRYTDRKSVV